jgi:hypothetical protein
MIGLSSRFIDSNNQWIMQRSGAQQTQKYSKPEPPTGCAEAGLRAACLDEGELLEATRWLESPSAADVGFSDALVALVQTSRARAEEAAHERERALFVEQRNALKPNMLNSRNKNDAWRNRPKRRDECVC